MFRRFIFVLFCVLVPLLGFAAEAPPAQQQQQPSQQQQPAAGPDLTTQGAAADQVLKSQQVERTNDFLEHVVDRVLSLFDVRESGNTVVHYVVAAVFLVLAVLLRRALTAFVFGRLRKIAARTRTTLDDKLFPALEPPCATAVVLVGIFLALRVLKLDFATDTVIGYAATVAFSLVIFWGLLRALTAVLDHTYEVALARQLGIAAFMPWIKKTLVAVFFVIGTLLVVQSLGYDVRALLAGLGLGGLAFALAAQDTLANLFGSVVVAIDQPFRIGEFIKIGANEGVVEDIGLRSTKLRTPAKNLIILPNKMVAAEAIVNNSRFIQRRVEQVIGLTYATTADKMEAIVAKIRGIIVAEREIDDTSVHVWFRDYSSSSLDIWLAYNTRDPDFAKHMALRQRINLAIMRAVQDLGLDFAFPTHTIQLDGEVARQLVAGKKQSDDPAAQRAGGPAGAGNR